MSYCRWSSDNWKCDLYCYADTAGGYTTRVAGRKYVGEIPEVPDILTTLSKVWLTAYKAQQEALEKCELLAIGLAEDGKIFSDPDLASFLKRVKWLNGLGYHVPNYVIEDIQKEMRDKP